MGRQLRAWAAVAALAVAVGVVSAQGGELTPPGSACAFDHECTTGYCDAIAGPGTCQPACAANNNCGCNDDAESAVVEGAHYLPDVEAYVVFSCVSGAPHFHDCAEPSYWLGGQPAWTVRARTRGMEPACGDSGEWATS
mmetsp:Transcript_10006/g.23717  ORF Transcript_10006/g.23717 Transcript_10006/m.23717 type:complete len:139 (-) Transcript_10006:32-448(-)